LGQTVEFVETGPALRDHRRHRVAKQMPADGHTVLLAT